MRSWPLTTGFFLVALSLVPPAYGQGAGADAERIKAAAEEFDAGRRAFKNKDFETAAGHFENADRDAPAPEALRSAIRARVEAKQLARAATLAASALVRYPDDKATSKLATSVLAQAEKQLYRLTVSCTPECTLLVDKKVTPFSETSKAVLFLEPGEHNVLAGWGGDRSVGEQVIAVAGESRELSFQAPPEKPKAAPVSSGSAQPAPTEAPPPPAPATGLPKGVFFVALGATVVLGGVSLWSGLDMRKNPGLDKVRQDCAGKDESCPTYQQGISAQRRTNILLAATGGAAVVTGVLGGFFTDWSGEKAAAKVGPLSGVVPQLAVGDGVAVGAAGQF